MKKTAFILTAFLLIIVYITGCGGGGSSGSSSSSGSEGGNVQIDVTYPQDEVNQELQDPDPNLFIQYYVIDLYNEPSDSNLPIQSVRIDYPDTTANFYNLPFGRYRVEVAGYDSDNSLKTVGTGYGDVSTTSSPEVVVSMSPFVSPVPSPTITISPSPTVSPTASPSPSPTVSPSPSPSPSPTPTIDEVRTELCSPPRIAEVSGRGAESGTINDDGTLVTFNSDQQLVADHDNSSCQIYIYDTEKGTLKLVSRNPQGFVGNYDSDMPWISGNGKYIAFHSNATNLLGTGMDQNDAVDVFVYDVVNNSIGRVSVKYGSPTQGGNDASEYASISEDGKYVGFQSTANNMVPANQLPYGNTNVYRATMNMDSGTPTTSKMELVSNANIVTGIVEAQGTSRKPRISRDGRYVVFESIASDIVASPASGAVKFLIYLADMNNSSSTRTKMISVDQAGGATDDEDNTTAHISDDASKVVFQSKSTKLPGSNGKWQIYLWDKLSGVTLVTKVTGTSGTGDSQRPTISGGGKYVSFDSAATNLVQNDTNNSTDCFVYNVETGAFEMISVNSSGVQAEQNSGSYNWYISRDGKTVIFYSYAKNLTTFPAPPSSSCSDVFLRRWMK